MTDKSEAFWRKKITELEMRIEALEKELALSQRADINNNEFYTIDEYAKIMKLCSATVYQRVHDGLLTAVKVGKCWRIPKNQIYKNS